MAITLRNVKGSPLTHQEMDENFSSLTGSLIAGNGLTGGGLKTDDLTFNVGQGDGISVGANSVGVNATVARTGSNTFTGDQIVSSSVYISGSLFADGGVLGSSTSTFSLLDSGVTTVEFAGSATSIDIGASTGTTNINNNLLVDGTGTVTGDLAVNGGDITSTSSTFNFVTGSVSTLNIGLSATSVEIGSTTGTTSINNSVDVDGDVNIDGGDLTTNQSTFNLVNTNATTVNIAGAGTTVSVGNSSGTVSVPGNLTVNGNANLGNSSVSDTHVIQGITSVTGSFAVDDIKLDGQQISTFTGNLELNPNKIVDLKSSLTASANDAEINHTGTGYLQVKSTGGVVKVENTIFNGDDVIITGSAAVNAGTITTLSSTGNIFNTNATTLNLAGAGTAINIGAPTGLTTVNNSLLVNGNATLGSSGTNYVDIKGSKISLSGSNTTIEHKAVTGNLRIQTTGGTNNKLILSSSGDINIEQSMTMVNLDTSYQSQGYQSGFAGQGFDINFSDKSSAEFDDLTVRGSLRVFELLINQIRATNGSLFVSSTGKVDQVVSNGTDGAGSASFILIFDTGSGDVGHGFTDNDIIRAQRVNRAALQNVGQTQSLDDNLVFRSDLVVTGIQDLRIITASLITGTTPPTGSFEYVRLGNSTNVNRQGAVYLTADDNYAPFIDVVDGITSHNDWNNSATAGGVKVRVGKIDGINSPVFGDLTGYGMWASGSVYLEGSVNATSGLIGGWAIYPGYLESNYIKLQSSGSAGGELIAIGQNASMSGNGIFLSGSGDFNIQAASSEFIRRSGNLLRMKSSDFSLEAGQLILSGSSTTGFIRVGTLTNATTVSTSNSGFYVDNSGNVLLKGNVADNNFVKVSGAGAVEIKSSDFDLVSGNLSLIGNSTSSYIKLGTLTDATTTGTTNSGFYADNNGNVLIKGNSNGTNYVKISGTGSVDINTNTFNLNAGSGALVINSAGDGGNGSITVGSSVTLNGSSSSTIAGFNISNAAISSSNAQLILRSNGQITGSSFLFGDTTKTSNYIDYAGSTLVVNGTINVIGGNAATQTYVNNATSSLSSSISTDISSLDGRIDDYETQVVLDNDGMSLRKLDGTILADYGTSLTFYDGVNDLAANEKLTLASTGLRAYGDNTTTYLDINSSGLTVVDNSNTKATFAASGATIYGDNATTYTQVNSSGLTVVDNSNTKATFSDTGATVYGDNSTTYTQVNSSGLTIVDNSTTVGSFTSTGVTVGNTTAEHVAITTSGVDLKDGSTIYGRFAATTTIGDTAAEHVSIDSDSIDIKNGATTFATFGTNTTITGGTITIRNSTNNNDKIEIGENYFRVFDNGTEVAEFGATTTIGDTATEHVEITSTGLKLKDGGTERLVMNSSGITIGSEFSIDSSGNATFGGALSAPTGNIGGFTIGGSQLYTGTKLTFASTAAGVYVGNDGIALGTDSPFKVTSTGELTAVDAVFTGYTQSDLFEYRILGITSTNQSTYLKSYTSGGNTYYVLDLTPASGKELGQFIRISTSGAGAVFGGAEFYLTHIVLPSNTPLTYTGTISIETDGSDKLFFVENIVTASTTLSNGATSVSDDFAINWDTTGTEDSFSPDTTKNSKLAFTTKAGQRILFIKSPFDWKIQSTNKIANLVLSGNLTLNNISNQASEATALMINGSNVVGYRELGSLAFSSATYDNYSSWTIRDGDTTTYTITSGDTLQIAAGTGITSNFTADDVLTITNAGVTSVAVGTGLDISAATGAITINLDLTEVGFTGGQPNRVITNDGDGTVTAESTLTFDGTTLSITGGMNATGTISGSLIRSSGDVVAYYTSDERLKDNISSIDNPLDKINKIGGYEFDWNEKQDVYTGHDYGVIAQEIEKVFPELVNTQHTGYKGVKYDRLVAVLIEGIKEQQKQIQDLYSQIEKLKGL